MTVFLFTKHHNIDKNLMECMLIEGNEEHHSKFLKTAHNDTIIIPCIQTWSYTAPLAIVMMVSLIIVMVVSRCTVKSSPHL